MSVFVVVHIAYAPESPPESAQRVTAVLDRCGLKPELDGRKGPVSLPPTCFAMIADYTLDAQHGLSYWRQQIMDQLSAELEAIGFQGSFFCSLSLRSCWGFRPVPRRSDPGNHGTNDLSEGLQ